MKPLLAGLLLLFQIQGAAPNITGFSIQGTTVNLDFYKGKQNVLLVFYRTHN